MFSSPWHYFTDPVLQGPTIGSILMCFSSALVGVIVFLRKRSLLGESLSHATYPGVVLSVLLVSTFFPDAEEIIAIAILIGAFFTSILGLWLIEKLERRFKVKNDAAMCLILAVFFGVGILIASRLQSTHALWYKTIQIFLYGQAATMTGIHVLLYLVLACLMGASVLFLYRQIEIMTFDRNFARSVGMPLSLLDTLIFILLVLAIVIGIRSVGVVLMAGMLIAPAVAARQFTDRLWAVFLLASLFGALSGFLGNYLSVELPAWGMRQGLGWKFSLPTGPMILLSASSLCLGALLFAPSYGLLSRGFRILHFRTQCLAENLLKSLWKKGEGARVSASLVKRSLSLSLFHARALLFYLSFQGWLEPAPEGGYRLTNDGVNRALRIVRLHRLWEVYLVHLGQGVEKVHRSAEEMEHILTPELEHELTLLLQDPKHDPHQQPIPRGKEP
ncbi:MAG: metal ABC transporter permease [Rhabdochlamydiaceae bacterium]|nr:metal ABC transporter permease [Rhabdochlamydiaceae bacterium]